MLRVLCFDLSGTVVRLGDRETKYLLRSGTFENALRRAGFERLVCVGNLLKILSMVRDLGVEVNDCDAVREYCGSAFADTNWFTERIAFVRDPEHRVREIEFGADWWYVDNEARVYFEREGWLERFATSNGERVLVPEADGDGSDILDWLARVPT